MDQSQIDKLKAHLMYAKALKDAMDRSLAAANPANVWKYTGYKQYMARYNDIALNAAKDISITAPIGTWNLDKVPGSGDTIAHQQQEFFESTYANLNILIAFLEHAIGLKADEIQNLRDFFGMKLRKAVFSEPEKEREIQDVLEQLLIGRGMERGVDYDRETGRVKVSVKEVIPDFIIPRLSLAIEVKLSKDKAKSKEIVDEINADIQAYGKKYSAIIFVVYDLGSIRDESEFKLGLETDGGLISIVVVKH